MVMTEISATKSAVQRREEKRIQHDDSNKQKANVLLRESSIFGFRIPCLRKNRSRYDLQPTMILRPGQRRFLLILAVFKRVLHIRSGDHIFNGSP
jgi:hypothetical protein